MADDPELEERLRNTPLVRLVAFAGHVTSQRFNRAMGRLSGLTAAGSGVLAALAWGAGRDGDPLAPARATHTELARRCLITPATLTGIVDTLERAGYVRRERDQADRRVVWLVVTEAGAQRVAEVAAHMRKAFAPTSAEHDPVKQAIIRDYLIELIMHSPDEE